MKKMSTLLTIFLLNVANCVYAVPIDPLHFASNLTYFNDVIHVRFSITETRNVSLWTDSLQKGENFHPNIILWKIPDTEFDFEKAFIYDHIHEEDPIFSSNQTCSTRYPSLCDEGKQFNNLDIGDYVVTLAMINNDPLGNTISEGFQDYFSDKMTFSDYKSEFGIKANAWWSLRLSGVDNAYVIEPSDYVYIPTSVPESNPLTLFGICIFALGLTRLRRVQLVLIPTLKY